MAASLHSLCVLPLHYLTANIYILSESILIQHQIIYCFRLTMACSAIYFLDMKGKVLVNRNYRGDIENNVIDKFIGWYF